MSTLKDVLFPKRATHKHDWSGWKWVALSGNSGYFTRHCVVCGLTEQRKER